MTLHQIVVGGRRPGPRLLITAGVHGDEFEPMVAVRELAEELRGAELRGTVVLVPVVNEPALAVGRRTADDGLDLARTCPGSEAGSTTERIAAALSQAIGAADYYVDLHTGGAALRLLPLAGYMLHHDPAILDVQRAMAAAFNLPFVWGTTPQLEGRSLSVARDAGVPAIYAEHGGGGGFDRAVVDDYRQGCLNVMRRLGLLEGSVAPNPAQQRIEDARPESGHLQVRHPAPADGLFLPSVALGQVVREGEPLGAVLHVSSGRRVNVCAECTGFVAMLRAAPRVEQGMGLAVVIEGSPPPTQRPS
ncbi:MAG: succinylglutamate desuccinylase [Planctomycetota bacterium]|nr:MAG: succinylglutamate desuccinylase [Planctomycetota bacterium]